MRVAVATHTDIGFRRRNQANTSSFAGLGFSVCGILWLFPSMEVAVDKATYDALHAILIQSFREGGRLENAMEAVRAAWLDYEAEQKGENR